MPYAVRCIPTISSRLSKTTWPIPVWLECTLMLSHRSFSVVRMVCVSSRLVCWIVGGDGKMDDGGEMRELNGLETKKGGNYENSD